MTKDELVLESMRLKRQYEENQLELLKIIKKLSEELNKTKTERDAVISDIEDLIKSKLACCYCVNRNLRWGICEDGRNGNCQPKWRGVYPYKADAEFGMICDGILKYDEDT